ncbi:uncharacterized protein C8A04DRAFT_15952 [Dichotomopilus funicola]|uniref:Pre-mRNA-splicing factor CWC24 n=1 Tax=Dichotomopilus funicola TaxID=1934379 RepID=A0AAN6UUT8_9PEZI|nr:hypothetical protein C8A04DRAFT_15952 [Dichotomopilus funicola]
MAEAESEPSTAPAAAPIMPVAIFKKRGAKAKANLRKRPATPPPAAANDSDSDDGSDFSSEEDASGERIKRRKRNTGAVVASSRNNVNTASGSGSGGGSGGGDAGNDLSATVYRADRTASLDTGKQEATKQSNWYDEEPADGAALSARNLLGSTRAMPPGKGSSTRNNKDDLKNDPPPAPDGLYKGLSQAATYTPVNPDAPRRAAGPIKAPPSNIRTITITDMAPDVCKDYKQTGFCGYGDGCKFLHAREDYAHGWQLDREWESVTRGKRVLGGTVVGSADRSRRGGDNDNNKAADEEDGEEAEAAMLEGIPFVCILCKGAYKAPVVTRCGHYFCEGCALKRYRKDPSCGACGAGTNGVFNAAKKLQRLLERKRERAARVRREAMENGEEVSEGEDE